MNDMSERNAVSMNRKPWTTPAVITATIVRESEGTRSPTSTEQPSDSLGPS